MRVLYAYNNRTSHDNGTYHQRRMIVYNDTPSKLCRLYRLSMIVKIVFAHYEYLTKDQFVTTVDYKAQPLPLSIMCTLDS